MDLLIESTAVQPTAVLEGSLLQQKEAAAPVLRRFSSQLETLSLRKASNAEAFIERLLNIILPVVPSSFPCSLAPALLSIPTLTYCKVETQNLKHGKQAQTLAVDLATSRRRRCVGIICSNNRWHGHWRNGCWKG
jgi:hypothetical protein